MAKLVEIIEEGMPECRQKLPESIREYHQFREHLFTVDGIVIYKDRVVIPPSLQQDCLSALYAAHQGVSSMMSRAEAPPKVLSMIGQLEYLSTILLTVTR